MKNDRQAILKEQQKSLEEMALAEGAKRFFNGLYGELNEEAVEVGIPRRARQDVSRTQPGRRLIVDYVEKVAAQLKIHCSREAGKKMGRSAKNVNPFLFAESLEGIAFQGVKCVIDFYFRRITRDKNPEAPRTDLINTLGNEVLLELCAYKARQEPSPEFTALEKASADKHRGDRNNQLQYLQRRRRRLIERMKKVDFKNDPELPVRIGMVIYHILLREGILKTRTIDLNKLIRQKAVMCRLAPDIFQELNQRLDRWAEDHPIWGPTVLPPRPWTKCDDGGYHFKLKNAVQLIKNRDGDITKAKCSEVFSAVNNLQSTSYCINQRILDIAHTVFQRKNPEEYRLLFKIPPASDSGVRPNMYLMIPPSLKREWLTVGVLKILKEAERLKNFQEIYFVHTMDFRGRIYPKSAYLNPQGTDLCRGLLLFGKAKPIADKDAVAWLANHGASAYGGELGRSSYADRINWVKNNTAQIRAVADAPLENMEFIEKVSKSSRWAFIAWCQEWSAFLDTGMGFESRLPVAVDGTCNGFQHFAALTKSSVLAKNVNLIPSGSPSDIYSRVARSALEEVKALPDPGDRPVKKLLEQYYRYLDRENHIAGNGFEPGENKSTAAIKGDNSTIPSQQQRHDDVEEESDIAIEEEEAKNKDEIDDAPEPDTIRDDDPEKFLAALGTGAPGKKIDGKRRKELLKRLQQCRRHLANTMLRQLVCCPIPVIKFDRDLFKPIVMTFPYSATHSSNMYAIYDELVGSGVLSDASLYYPEGVDRSHRNLNLEFILAHAISRFARKAINKDMPQANEIMGYLRNLLPPIKDTKAAIRWRTPCGLTVCQHYPYIYAAKRVKIEYSGERIYIRKLGEATVGDGKKHRQSISPNFVHSCDAAHLMKTANTAFTNGITHFLAIHDSYATHASDMSTLRRILRDEFVKMYEGKDLLAQLRTDMGASDKKDFAIDKENTFDINKVREAEYFFS
jgi:DNA-directed RNA polymerase